MVAVTVAPGIGWFADLTKPLWAYSPLPAAYSASPTRKGKELLGKISKCLKQLTTTGNQQPLPVKTL
jgi:hypothetical protein